jgi:hypothetical protein
VATVRELVVSLGLDFNSSGFGQAEKAIAALKTGFAGVGALLAGMAAGLTGITVAVTKQADELRDLSLTLGVSTEAIQKLGYAAQLSGANADTLKSGLIFLARNAEAAGSGSKEAAENFAKFGVNIRDQNGHLKTADRLLLDVANGAKGMTDGTQRAALAAQMLGRNAGPQLVQFLSQGEDGIAALGAELEALGGFMDSDFIEASADFNDSLDRMQVVVKGLGITVAKAFLPFLSSAVKGLVEWYRANREVINSRVTFFVERMASAFNGLGNIIGLAVGAVSRITNYLSTAHPIFLTTAAIIGLLGLVFSSTFNKLTKGFFPLVVLTTLIALIADDINAFVTGGKSVLGDFVTFMRKWGQETGGVFGGLIETVAGFIEWFQGAGWDAVTKEMTDAIDIAIRFWEDKLNGVVEFVTGIVNTIKAVWRNLFTDTASGALGSVVAAAGGMAEVRDGAVQGETSSAVRSGLTAAGRGLLDAFGSIGSGLADAGRGIASGFVSNPATGAAVSSSNVSSIEVNVTAAAGREQEAAKAMREQLEEMRKEELRNARSALVPAKATP